MSQLCVFCGVRPAASNEHVFPLWLKRALPDQAKMVHSVRVDPAGVPVEELKVPFDVTTDTVCNHCNTHWMSNLQNWTKPVLLPMITGATSVRLTPKDQQHIACWSAMTAMTFQQVIGNGPIPAELYSLLFMGRRRRPPFMPGRFTVDLARYGGEQLFGGISFRALNSAELVAKGQYGEGDPPWQGFGAMLTAGTLVVRLFACWGLPNDLTITIGHGSLIAPVFLEIWPRRDPAGNDVIWPPAHRLSDEDLTAMENAFVGN
jgi:hypothetical protein